MPPDPRPTREKLIRAAEHLFARRGLDVPISEIHAQAGQRNESALHYHFGDKQGLIQAILERHSLGEAEAAALREELRRLHPDAEAVVRAIVERLCASLASPEGRDWARITSQVVLHAPIRQAMLETAADVTAPLSPSLAASMLLIRHHVPSLPERLVSERALAGLAFMTFVVANRAREIDDGTGAPEVSHEDFAANLVDVTVGAMLGAGHAAAIGTARVPEPRRRSG